MRLVKLCAIFLMMIILCCDGVAYQDTLKIDAQNIGVIINHAPARGKESLLYFQFPQTHIMHWKNISSQEISSPHFHYIPKGCYSRHDYTAKRGDNRNTEGQSYVRYCQTQQRQPLRIFAVDQKLQLISLDSNLNAISILPMKQVVSPYIENDDNLDLKRVILKSHEAYYDGAWHTILCCVLPFDRPVVVIFDLSISTLALPKVISVTTLDRGQVYDCQILRWHDHRWHILLAQQLAHSGYYGLLLRLPKGQLEKAIPLLHFNSSNIAGSEPLSVVTIDSINQGFVDVIYSAHPNRLGKHHFMANHAIWHHEHLLKTETGYICSKPKVKRHPSGVGHIVYIVIRHHQKYRLLAIWDKAQPFALHSQPEKLWVLEFDEKISQPSLMQNALLLSVGNTKLAYYVINPTTGEVQYVANLKKMPISQNAKSDSTDLHDPVLPLFQDMEQGYQLLAMSEELGFYTGKLDFKYAKLAALTWHQEDKL